MHRDRVQPADFDDRGRQRHRKEDVGHNRKPRHAHDKAGQNPKRDNEIDVIPAQSDQPRGHRPCHTRNGQGADHKGNRQDDRCGLCDQRTHLTQGFKDARRRHHGLALQEAQRDHQRTGVPRGVVLPPHIEQAPDQKDHDQQEGPAALHHLAGRGQVFGFHPHQPLARGIGVDLQDQAKVEQRRRQDRGHHHGRVIHTDGDRHDKGNRPHHRRHHHPAGRGTGLDRASVMGRVADLFHGRNGDRPSARDVRENRPRQRPEKGAGHDRYFRRTAAVLAKARIGQIDKELPRPRGDQHARKDQKAQHDLGDDLGGDAHQPFGTEDMRLDHAFKRIGDAHQQTGEVIGHQRVKPQHQHHEQEGDAPRPARDFKHQQPKHDARVEIGPARLHDLPCIHGEPHADAKAHGGRHDVIDRHMGVRFHRWQRDERRRKEGADEDPVILPLDQTPPADGNAEYIGQPHPEAKGTQQHKSDAGERE